MARSTETTTPEEKLQRILDAAGELFAREGYRQTPVDAIASLAGVSKGLIYVHFPSKEALLKRVMQRSMTAWFDEGVRSALRADCTATEMLVASVRSSIAYVKSDPVLCGIIAQDPRLLLLDGKSPEALVQGYTRAMASLLQFGVDRGEFRKDLNVDAAAGSLWLVHDALVRELFVQPTLPEQPPEQVLESALGLVLGGLLARKP